MNTKIISNLSVNNLTPHLDELSDEYFKLTGRKVCKSCESDLQNMLNTLKSNYMESNFQLKSATVIYKIKKGEAETITNGSMTDEKALKFLSVDKSRAKVFSKLPENWEELVDNLEEGVSTPPPTSPEPPADPNSIQVSDPAQVTLEGAIEEVSEEDDCSCDDDTKDPCPDCLKAQLMEMGFNDLRAAYPDVKQDKGSSKEAFVDKVIASQTPNQ
ncbi:MAG: hypothetical protein AAGC43_04615 [Bacteroidota bacterium]